MISVITLFSWVDNDLELLKANIERTVRFTDEEFEHIIIDNDCLPSVKDYLKTLEGIKILSCNGRVGVGRAYNLGISNSTGNEIFIHDSDIVVQRKGWTQLARRFYESSNNMFLNIPAGWYINKEKHIKKVVSFFSNMRDNVLRNISNGDKYYSLISDRLSSDLFVDEGIQYQWDIDSILSLNLAGIERGYCEFKEIPLLFYYNAAGGRPIETMDTIHRKIISEISDYEYQLSKWSYILRFGELTEDQKSMIINSRVEDWWGLEYFKYRISLLKEKLYRMFGEKKIGEVKNG